jgi:hypothetical protein
MHAQENGLDAGFAGLEEIGLLLGRENQVGHAALLRSCLHAHADVASRCSPPGSPFTIVSQGDFFLCLGGAKSLQLHIVNGEQGAARRGAYRRPPPVSEAVSSGRSTVQVRHGRVCILWPASLCDPRCPLSFGWFGSTSLGTPAPMQSSPTARGGVAAVTPCLGRLAPTRVPGGMRSQPLHDQRNRGPRVGVEITSLRSSYRGGGIPPNPAVGGCPRGPRDSELTNIFRPLIKLLPLPPCVFDPLRDREQSRFDSESVFSSARRQK